MKCYVSLAVVSLALVGCGTTRTSAVLGGETPETVPAQWDLVGPVEGRGSAFALSPGIQKLFGAMDTVDIAKEDAIGQAIYDNSNVDMIVAPKSRVYYMSFLGIFDTASAAVKGQGIKLR